MLLKFKSNAFVFAIFGVALMICFAILLSFNKLNFSFISNNDGFKIALLLQIPLCIYYIISPNKVNTIAMLVLSALSFNVFFFISTIFVLVEMSNQEKLNKKVNNEEIVNEEKEENNEEILYDEKDQKIIEFLDIEKKKIQPHIEYTKKEENQIIISIALSSIYIGLYSLFWILNRNLFMDIINHIPSLSGMMDAAGPAAMAFILIFLIWLFFLIFYVAFCIILPAAPFIIFILNIIISFVALKKKSYKSVNAMRTMGLLSLTIVNYLAARNALRRTNEN